MGIFDKIKGAIWGQEAAAPPATPATESPQVKPVVASASGAPARPSASVAPTPAPARPSASATPTPAPASTARPTPPAAGSQPVDVAAMLDAAVKRNGQKLNWRRSIVDLMKALDLDSSLAHRKELAKELDYTGDTGNSAAMNMWLHKALMKKLADNGGRVPPELLD